MQPDVWTSLISGLPLWSVRPVGPRGCYSAVLAVVRWRGRRVNESARFVVGIDKRPAQFDAPAVDDVKHRALDVTADAGQRSTEGHAAGHAADDPRRIVDQLMEGQLRRTNGDRLSL